MFVGHWSFAFLETCFLSQALYKRRLKRVFSIKSICAWQVFRLLCCSESYYAASEKTFDAVSSFVILEDTRRAPSTRGNQTTHDRGDQTSTSDEAAANETDSTGELLRTSNAADTLVENGHERESVGGTGDGLPKVESCTTSGGSGDGVGTAEGGEGAGVVEDGNHFDASRAVCVVTTHLYWHPEG